MVSVWSQSLESRGDMVGQRHVYAKSSLKTQEKMCRFKGFETIVLVFTGV